VDLRVDLAACLAFDPRDGIVCGPGPGTSNFDSACNQCEWLNYPFMQCRCNGALKLVAIGMIQERYPG
jgi:hypothetical protein